MSPEAKRQRKICATFHLFLEHAREIWGRDKAIARSTQIEDREFREMFGCGVGVAVSCWEKLVEKNLVPDKGSSRHLLWALMFLKVYGKECTMCKLAGVKDPKTFRYQVWIFNPAIAELESSVVRYKPFFCHVYILISISHLLLHCRLFLIIVLQTIVAMIV